MGRARGRRHKLQYEVHSVGQKCIETRLRVLIRREFGVCEAEAGTIASASLDYLREVRREDRDPFDVMLEVPVGRGLRWKVAPERARRRQVVVSPITADDTDVCLEQGVRGMQTARAVRLIEQADRAGCTMPQGLLASCVHQTTRTLTSRLRPLWDQCLYLPVLGVAGSSRPALSRLALVLRDHLQGRGVGATRRQLFLSPAAYGRLLHTASRLLKGYIAGMDGGELADRLMLSPVEVESTLEVMRVEERSPRGRQRLEAVLEADTEPVVVDASGGSISSSTPRSSFEAYLIRRHTFSVARAELLADAVEEAAKEQEGLTRSAGEIVFWAIACTEGAGKPLSECEVVPVRLVFYSPGEDDMPRGTMGDLKVRKAERFAVAAHRQGGLLCLPDLAFLLGMAVSSLQRALSRSRLVLPTRGNIADIGRGMTHRREIVTLYVHGYTEPQIVARTSHSYESVASYISDFSRVMLLLDQGLPALHIRKVTRMGLALVKTYIALYQELDVPENQWKLNLMRRPSQETEKKSHRSR